MAPVKIPDVQKIAIDGPSLIMRLTMLYLRSRGKRLGPRRWPDTLKQLQSRKAAEPAPMPPSLRRRCRIETSSVDGSTVFVITPRRRTSAVHVVYIHGGAYVDPILSLHWMLIDRLVEATGATFVVPLYPLAPEHDHRPAFAMVEKLYRDLYSKVSPRKIILMGDSAGGGLAVAQAMRYRDIGLPAPGRLVLFAPWLDITLSNPEVRRLEPHDPLLGTDGAIYCGERWAGDEDTRHPYLSPMFGDWSRLPPIDIHVGTNDMCVADVRRLYDQAPRYDMTLRLFEYRKAFHVFMAATWTAESRDAVARVASTLRELDGPA
jgi:epsilon-lactone hydrolase